MIAPAPDKWRGIRRAVDAATADRQACFSPDDRGFRHQWRSFRECVAAQLKTMRASTCSLSPSRRTITASPSRGLTPVSAATFS